MIVKSSVSKYFKIIIAVISFIGLISNLIVFKNIKILLYYTLLSNLFVFVFYTIDSIFNINKTNKYHLIKGLMLLSILCTMVIYYFTLSSKQNIYEGHPLICSIVHLIVPLLVLIECLVFETKKELKYRYIFYWLIPLFLYFIFILIFGFIGGTFLNGQHYPYDFLNINKYGLIGCSIKCLMILIFYILLGLIIIFIDNKIKNRD